MIFKQIPTIISGISQLGDAAKKLKNINFSIVGLNTGNIDAYRNAISGISKEQASLLLSTKGLNQAQIELILSNENVTASEIAEASALNNVAKTKNILTIEQQKQLLTSNALTQEKLAEIAATIGLETAENGSLISKQALNAEMVKQQLESIGIVGTTQTQIINMLGLATAETTAATGANVLSGAMTKLNIIMATNPIGALITAIGIAIASVYGLTKAFDALTDSAEEIDKRADNLIEKYNELKSTADNNAATIESLISEYELLSKGVDKLGKNVSLTSDEYNRYNEIVNQIADMFPKLITGYTDEGTAILSLKGNVEELRDAYREAQQEAYNLIISTGKDTDGNDIVKSYKNLSKLDWWNSDHVLFGGEDVTTVVKRDITKQILSLMNNMDTAVDEYNKLAQEIFDTYGNKGYNFLEEMGLPAIKDIFSDTTNITEDALKAGRATVQSYYQGFQAEIDNGLSNYKLATNAFLNVNDFYKDENTSEEIKNALSIIVNNINEDIANSFNSMNDIGIYVNEIINKIKNNKEAQQALIDLFTIDTSDIPIEDIIDQINSYINIIANTIDETPADLKIRLGFEDINDLEAQYQRAIDYAKDKFDGYDLTDFFKQHSINTKEEIDTWQEIAQRVNNATEAEKEYLKALNSEKDTEKITTISGILEKFGQTEAIDEYKDKISSLQSYLEKLEDGSFSPIDSEALAKEFNIVGDTAEECIDKINAKIQSEKNNIIAIIDDIIEQGVADGSIGDAELERLRSYRDILADIADVNLDNQLSFKTGNALADVQSLSQGLDQLDKIYADILDKEDFDFSSILNNDGFKEAFGAYTEEYDNFINTVSKSPDDINACQDAFNKLTAAYIYGTGVLDEVTESTKAGTIAMLEQMGVSNAAAIVEQALAKNEEVRKYATEAVAAATSDLSGKTEDASKKLLEQANMSETARKALFELVAQQTIFANQDLGFREKITGLEQLANAYMGVAKAATFQDKFEENLRINGARARHGKKELSVEEVYQQTMEQVGGNVFPQVQEVEIKYTGGTTTKDTRDKIAKEQEKAAKDAEKASEEVAEPIDFINIKLNNLIDTASKLKDKISDLLSFGSKKKQTQKAIEATTKALEAEYKAMKKYAEVAKTLSADAAKETTETVTESISGAVSDAVSNMTSSVASDVVAEAMKYVGVLDYVWGGESLTKGADCSGFVQQVYRKLGMEIPRNTTGQYGDPNSISVSKADLQPGDLVFFQGSLGSPGNPRHVGIYAGNGQFIDSPTTGKKVQITSLSRRSDYVGAKRYAGASSAAVSPSVSTDTSSSTKTYTKVVPGVDAKTLAHYQKLVREGSFDVETITNEKLKNAIKSYQEWYEKMKSCRDKIEELNNTLRELYQTMAEIPIEKRDKNVETLDTRLDIINSKRDNINAVIVNPKKYASTQKTLKQSKTSVKKGIKTKAQRNATGLSKTEIDTIKDQMKKGQTIPAKILDKITNGAFYEQCKQYNDAVYEHSQYAKSIRTAGDFIKKFNTISDQILDAEKSKTKQYKTAYNTTSKSYAKSLDNVKSKGAQTKKAFGSKKFGLTNADIKRINSCIKSGKQIPTDLMVQLQSQSIFDSCVEYNKAVMENEILREKLDETRFDLQKQQQAETAARLEVKTEKHQNIADKASAKMERNEALAENADTPKKKNKYLSKNLDLLQTEYKHLIKIAELENDSVKAAKLRAELEKETADIIEQQFQNISDYYSARRDKISDKESLQDLRYENAQVDVKKKNDILNIKTRFATETNAESEQEYTDTAKLFNSNRTDAKKAVNKVKKLSSSDKSKILKLMESKEEIPENLMDKVAKLDPDAYQKLLNYNDSLDWLEKAALNKKISNEELIKTKRENEIQKHQNIADRAQDKIDKNDALSNISTTASEQNKYEKENIKYLNTQYKHLLEIAKLHEDDVEYARLEAELQSKIAESYKAMFDNVQTEFENKISLITNDISDLDNEIKKVEASGRLIDASYYNYKISMENETLEKLKEEESSLVEQLKNVKMFSPAWYECQDAIQSVQNAQADSLASIKEYKDAINEIANTIQNDIVDAFHDITNEAELLITLLGDNLSDSDIGGLTEDGLAVLSLYVSQMNVCQEAAESFHKEIKSMQDALDNNTLSFIDANGIQRDYASIFELKKHIKDFYSSYQDEIKHVYDYESKVVDMMIKKYQSELDYLKELIEKKQKALSLENDLFEYSKNIQKQTDNINSLRKQIVALQGDTSKETESRIQKLQSQLKDAQDELSDTEYDRYISDQKDMLDNLYDEYAKLVEDIMNDHDRLLKEALDLFAQTGADVQDVIRAVADEYNYEITGEMEKIISSIEGMGSLDTYLGVGGTITQSLGDIVNEVHNAYVGLSSDMQGMKDAVASIGYQGKYDTSDVNNTDNYIHDTTDTGNSSNTSTGSNSDTSTGKNDNGKDFESLIDHLLRNGTNKYDPKTTSSLNRYIYSKYGSALTVDEMSKLSEYLGFNYTPAQLSKDDKNHSKRKMKMLDELKVHGFSNGGIVPDDALKVRDIGIKPASNGDDRLVALKPKESVFNEKQTKMIQEYVNKGPDLNSIKNIVPIMDKMMKMPEVEKKEIPTQNIMQIGDVSFNLPNVYDYADLMNEAKNDPKFEEMIARIMKHQLGFGSYLKKTNVNFRH